MKRFIGLIAVLSCLLFLTGCPGTECRSNNSLVDCEVNGDEIELSFSEPVTSIVVSPQNGGTSIDFGTITIGSYTDTKTVKVSGGFEDQDSFIVTFQTENGESKSVTITILIYK